MKEELPEDRLATTSERGDRVFLYPARVSGIWHNRRRIVHFLLMLFFVALPWIKINGSQALLLDVVHRKFSIFGLQFWAHDAPMLILVLATFVFGVAFITSNLGRVWCGWTCPQTVYTESIYAWIETLIEGDSVVRRRLDGGPWTGEKIFKKVFKWSIFSVISWAIAHCFLAYFVGAEQVIQMIQQPPSQNPGTFKAVFVFTGIILFDFGWFREQFCVIMCPYGRLQAVMMDEHSLAVLYNKERGEPRRGSEQASDTKKGDCIDCGRCVAVCPTGIDIRRGVQMECIACTRCIDACDEVMIKVKKPVGLIAYGSELPSKQRILFRPRTLIYFGVLIAVMAGLTTLIMTRSHLDVALMRAKETPYHVLKTDAGDRVLNHFKVDLRNQTFAPMTVEPKLTEEAVALGASLTQAVSKIELAPGEKRVIDLFVQTPNETLTRGHVHASLAFAASSTEKEFAVKKIGMELIGPFK